MKAAPRPIRQIDVTRVLKGVAAAGLIPARVVVDYPAGRVEVVPEGGTDAATNLWDEALK